MLKVLINAYAVCPGRGSEEGMGWNWCSNLARYCELYIITESEFQAQIENALENDTLRYDTQQSCYDTEAEPPTLTENSQSSYETAVGLRNGTECAYENANWAKNMHFYFVDAGDTPEESEKIRQMCWKQGTWSFYWYYEKWQRKALAKAKEIIRELETQEVRELGDDLLRDFSRGTKCNNADLTNQTNVCDSGCIGSQSVRECKRGIDVMHQLNMVGFREPGMLYQINRERVAVGLPRIPLVWGPSAGYGSIPMSFRFRAGLKECFKYNLKAFLNEVQLRFHPRVRAMAKECDALIAATPAMKEGLEKVYHREVVLNSEVGCTTLAWESRNSGAQERAPLDLPSRESSCWNEDNGNIGNLELRKFSERGMKLLWVGRFMYTKQLDMALRVVQRLKDMPGLELHIVGEWFTPDVTERMHQMARDLGIDHLCTWYGKIPNAEVQQLMQECDLLFFTSIFEATSTVILEAITNRLPILCFDTCGFGAVVDETIGYKIPLKNFDQGVVGFAQSIQEINAHREWLSRWSENCREKQKQYDWEDKTREMVKLYELAVRATKRS